MIEQILIGALLVGMCLLPSLGVIVLLTLFRAQGLITDEEAIQTMRDMANGQVWLCGR